ncbi:MAG: hypothetical protein WCF65_02765 [Parachlamydiaceae bacterium]
MNTVIQYPPGICTNTFLDSFYKYEDNALCTQWMARTTASIEHCKKDFAERICRLSPQVSPQVSSGLLKMLCLAAKIIFSPEEYIRSLTALKEKVEKLWSVRSSVHMPSSDATFPKAAKKILYALAGGKVDYDMLPAKDQATELQPLYKTTQRKVSGLGIKCFDVAGQRPISVEIFLEDVKEGRYSAFAGCCRGPKFRVIVLASTKHLTCSITESYPAVRDLMRDPKGWVRAFFQLIRYGNTGVMNGNSAMHALLKSSDHVPTDFFPTTQKAWP